MLVAFMQHYCSMLGCVHWQKLLQAATPLQDRQGIGDQVVTVSNNNANPGISTSLMTILMNKEVQVPIGDTTVGDSVFAS